MQATEIRQFWRRAVLGKTWNKFGGCSFTILLSKFIEIRSRKLEL